MPPVSKKVRLPNGEEVEVFYIAHLASALGRTSGTIRKWEISGVIPDSCFKDSLGRRMYTQEQIDVIVRCAERAKISQGLSIANTSFSNWVHKELDELRKKYLGKE